MLSEIGVMIKIKNLLVLAVLAAIFLPIIALAASNATTTMTWVVPANKSFTVTYGSTCSQTAFYFVESTCGFDSDVDGNGARCLPYPDSEAAGTVCQSASVAPILITNNGNTSFNLDGNFTSAFTGVDTNLLLKVWMGTGGGCGTSGLGGWAESCTVTVATNPVTSTTCRNYNALNDLNAGRLTTSLAVNDSNQLCFSGDFNAGFGNGISQGSHAKDFNLTAT